MQSSVIILMNKLLILNGLSVFFYNSEKENLRVMKRFEIKKLDYEPMFSSVKSISPGEIEEVNLNRQTLRTSCATLMEGSSDLF